MRELPVARSHVTLPDRRTKWLRRPVRIYPPSPVIAAAEYDAGIVVVCAPATVMLYDPQSQDVRGQSIFQGSVTDVTFRQDAVELRFDGDGPIEVNPAAL